LLGLLLDSEDGGYMFLRNGVISQQIVFFLNAAVRTSNPTFSGSPETDTAVMRIGDPKSYCKVF
jgi:hypothetical protein